MPSNTLTGPTQCDLHDFVFCRFVGFKSLCIWLSYFLVPRVSQREKLLVMGVWYIPVVRGPHFFYVLCWLRFAAYYCADQERILYPPVSNVCIPSVKIREYFVMDGATTTITTTTTREYFVMDGQLTEGES